jgi:ribosome-associated protein
VPPLRDLRISPRRVLPARLLSFRSVRAGGPGGQHVNKVATRVVLTLDLEAAEALLSPEALTRIRSRLARRLDARGRLTVTCSATRQRARNLERAHERMESLLRDALARPQKRHATRPTLASRSRRLAGKRKRAQTKRMRTAPQSDDA